MRGASIGIFVILAVIGVVISGCLGSGDNAVKDKKGPYSYVPGPVDTNPDMSDPYKVVEEAVDAIKANDYKAFERLLSPDFKAQIGGDENLKQLVQKQHDKMFEKRAGNDVRINNFADEKNKFYINDRRTSNEVSVTNLGDVWLIDEW